MSRILARVVVLSLASLSLAGCAYDRSFMQMDSNSGVPFFGMQWAVDSGSRPSSHTESSTLTLDSADAELTVPDSRLDRRKVEGNDPSPGILSVSLRGRR